MVSIAWAFCDGTGTSCVAIAALQRLPSCVLRGNKTFVLKKRSS